ncbi:cytochrome P450 [Gongronella butleri]|nr:cytochrome P450 [Gongronella butleri]
MLTQYLYELANRFDHRKTMDQLQSLVNTKEGAIGITAAAVLLVGATYAKSKRDYGCPEVPASSWTGSSTDEYRKDPKAFIKKWEHLGQVWGAQLFGHHAIVVSGRYVREVFLNDKFDFIVGLNRTFDNILLTNSGPHSAMPATLTADAVKKFLSPNLKHFTARVIEHLQIGLQEQIGQVGSEGKQFPHMYSLMQNSVAMASAAVFVGPDLAKDKQLIDSFKNMVLEVGSEVLPKPWLEPFPLLMKARMYWIGKTSANVQRHRAQLAAAIKPEVTRRLKAMASGDSNWDRPDDIMQDIMENYSPPAGMDTVTYMVNWLTQLIFAAVHTTSENSTWVLYRLLANPEVMDDLLEEQNEVLAEAGYSASSGPEVFTREILNKFTKMDSVIRETMRVRTAYIALPHVNVSNSTIVLSNGTKVYPGDSVYINVWANHNDAQLQSALDDVSEFKPYRFLDTDKNSTKIGEDFLFFGLGKRACPGRWFAIQETKTIIALLIREYKMAAVGDIFFPAQEGIPFPFGEFNIAPRKPVSE